MTGAKTNERPGTRAVHRYASVSASKAREVLDLIRGKTISEAYDILQFNERAVSRLILKVLDSAVANAVHNDQLPDDELYVSACFADEGPTLKRFRPRARGRATRVRKRTCHITVIVSRLPEEELARIRAHAERSTTRGRAVDARRRRVEQSRQREAARAEHDHEHDHDHDHDEAEAAEIESADTEAEIETTEAAAEAVEAEAADEKSDTDGPDTDGPDTDGKDA